MNSSYFHRVRKETPSIVWVNNPSEAEAFLAIEAGAVSCTTNPAYCSKLFQKEPYYLYGVIEKIVQEENDDTRAAELVYQIATKRIADAFLPIYENTKGQHGFVTMQGDPRNDHDADAIIAEGLRFRNIGPNLMVKIPVTKAGLKSLACFIDLNVPICATEIFSISQAIQMCEVYRKISELTGNRPPFYVTHITGIIDQLFKETVKGEQINISSEVLGQAGTIIARKQYQLMRQRGYPGMFLGGGARGLEHFTEFVGGNLAVTLNWNTMEELISKDGPIQSRIDTETSAEVVAELRENLPNFRRAYDDGALPLDEFEDFGPLVFFKTQFLNGYTRLLDAIADQRLRTAMG
jgi:transaldolase